VPGAGGIGVVLGARGVVVVRGGIEVPEPTPFVDVSPAPGDVPSVLVPLGDMPGVLVPALGGGAIVLPLGPGVVWTVPPVVFGSWPVVVLGLVGAMVEPLPPMLLPPPPAPRLELPLPAPLLPPMLEPPPTLPELPAAPPLAPPALPPAANAAGAVRISKAAVAVSNRFVMSAVMPIHPCMLLPARRRYSPWITRRLRVRSDTPPALTPRRPWRDSRADRWRREPANER
jgi:hypothetical protein